MTRQRISWVLSKESYAKRNMPKKLEAKLRKNGWERKHIHRVIRIIDDAHANKHPSIKMMDAHVYWILLVVIAIANFAISIALLPSVMALSGIFLYVVLATAGLIFGLAFELVIRSIEHLEYKHHVALGFIIPAVAAINIFLMAGMANNVKGSIGFGHAQSPFLISIVYAIAFVLPFFWYKFIL